MGHIMTTTTTITPTSNQQQLQQRPGPRPQRQRVCRPVPGAFANFGFFLRPGPRPQRQRVCRPVPGAFANFGFFLRMPFFLASLVLPLVSGLAIAPPMARSSWGVGGRSLHHQPNADAAHLKLEVPKRSSARQSLWFWRQDPHPHS